jgi:spore germination protein KB
MNNPLKENISLWQLFVLIITYETGTAVVVGVGNDAKQDAWIAVLIATFLGVPLVWMYWFLLSKVPDKNLFEIMEELFGRIPAMGLTLAYILFFFYDGTRDLRDFDELMASAILPKTPIEVISITLIFVIAYILHLGLEVLGRTSEIFIPYIMGFILIVAILLLFSGEFRLRNLQPVLAEGFLPILKAVFPGLLGFPFGEMVVFTIVMDQTSKFKHVGKVSMIAIGLVGLLLVTAVVLQISTLGVDTRGRSNFPMLAAARYISIANFVERVDALVVFIMMLGVMVKISLLFYGGLKGLEYIFRIPYRPFVFPMATLFALFSILIAENFAEHIQEGLKFVPLYIHMPFEVVLPIFILVFALWQQHRKKQLNEKEET